MARNSLALKWVGVHPLGPFPFPQARNFKNWHNHLLTIDAEAGRAPTCLGLTSRLLHERGRDVCGDLFVTAAQSLP